MFVFFGVFEVKLDDTADIIVGLVNGELDSFTFFVSVLEDFGFLFLVKNDINVNGAAESTEEAAYCVLSKGEWLPWTDDKKEEIKRNYINATNCVIIKSLFDLIYLSLEDFLHINTHWTSLKQALYKIIIYLKYKIRVINF